MSPSQKPVLLANRLVLVVGLYMALCGVLSCKSASNLNKEIAYVNAPQVFLRDKLATIYEKKGMVKLGEKVYVLDHQRRFSLVRTERNEEGWISDRYLVGPEIFNQFEKLKADNAATPVQAHGTTRALVNLHVTPGRDTDHLYQLQEGDKIEILRRGTAPKPDSMQPRPPVKTAKKAGKKEDIPAGPAMEDWSLIRGDGRVGWVLTRMIDIDVPLEIAGYAEGQRIVSSFVLSEVKDGDKRVPQYLVMLTDNRDGLPWDYNQIRVFSWNLKRHRYETAYRERNLVGVFPVMTGEENFGKDGVLPVFTLRTRDDQGKESERKYRMTGPIVRRVASPEELKKEAEEKAAHRAANPRSARKRSR